MARSSAQFRVAVPRSVSLSPSKVVQSATKFAWKTGRPLIRGPGHRYAGRGTGRRLRPNTQRPRQDEQEEDLHNAPSPFRGGGERRCPRSLTCDVYPPVHRARHWELARIDAADNEALIDAHVLAIDANLAALQGGDLDPLHSVSNLRCLLNQPLGWLLAALGN